MRFPASPLAVAIGLRFDGTVVLALARPSLVPVRKCVLHLILRGIAREYSSKTEPILCRNCIATITFPV
jgi:hypothetical protein